MPPVPKDDSRPYHHGDLRRALIEAARALVEQEGPADLSLRAVARAAGVSPAAPYHHFPDKGALLDAVADEGWQALAVTLQDARTKAGSAPDILATLGVAYVCFARDNPELYRLMYDRTRDKDALPDTAQDRQGAYNLIKRAVRLSLGQGQSQALGGVDLELATLAIWCAAHGLAEMRGFKRLDPVKDQLGGEEAFLRGVFDHLGMLTQGTSTPA